MLKKTIIYFILTNYKGKFGFRLIRMEIYQVISEINKIYNYELETGNPFDFIATCNILINFKILLFNLTSRFLI